MLRLLLPLFRWIDIDDILSDRRQIGIIWTIEDMLTVRPDLSDDEAWQVLQYAHRFHDASVGMTWETLESRLTKNLA